MIKPVYLFTGFLDAGKTQAIKTSMLDPYFNADEVKTMIILMEDGECKYDVDFLEKTHSFVEDFTERPFDLAAMEKLEKEREFDRVVIEFNGFGDLKAFMETGFIANWQLAESLCFMNSQSFGLYITNLKQFVYNMVVVANVVIFNRFNGENKRFYYNNLKAINPYIQIVFENLKGEIEKIEALDLFDLNAKPLVIEYHDYGLWYLDALDHPQKYEDHEIVLKLKKLEDLPNYHHAMIMGRQAMVCCANDLADIGLTVVGIDKSKIVDNQYYALKGVIHLLDNEVGEKTCVLYADEFAPIDGPSEEFVTFN